MHPRALLAALVAALAAGPAGATGSVVLVPANDSWTDVCSEIARQRGAELVSGVDEAVRRAPRSVVLCASPERLDDRLLLALSEKLDPVDGIGVLTGVDPTAVRGLASRKVMGRGPITIARAANPSAHWSADIRTGSRVLPLTVRGFQDALRSSRSVSFSGHGDPTYLRFGRDPDVLFRAADVPPVLPPLLFMSGSCQTFRFWEAPPRSVALALTRAGAAAYIGFLYSPVEGFLPGQLDGAPALASHPGFPLGRVVRLLNEATEQRFARLPYLYLLGDPGLAALPAGPEVVRLSPTRFRVRHGAAGWIAFSLPVQGREGWISLQSARHPVSGVPLSGAFHEDLIAVVRPGAVDVLARVPAGDLTVELTPGSATLRTWAWELLQSTDSSLPFLTASHSPGAFLVLSAAWLAALLLLARRRVREIWRGYWAAFLGWALVWAATYLAYCWLRWPHVTVTTKALRFEPASVLVPVLAGAGALLARLAVARRGRAILLAAVAAGFPWLAAGAALALGIAGGNLLMARSLGTAIWSLRLAAPLLETGLLLSILAGICLALPVRKNLTPPG